MLISYNWLRELTGTALTARELRDRLTMVGLAVDAVEERDTDAILDVEVPSNRPDCLSHLGLGREVTVIESRELRYPVGKTPHVEGRAESFTSVDILDPHLCPRYAARIVRGVRIGPSPAWLANRLEGIGQRPINNVADITNYVLHEMGQPLHAFDLAKLGEQRIVVRRAARGEKLKTLDGVERDLDPEMLVIADAKLPVALAGIMGGEESEISESTTDVLIESAYFDPDSVRRTARQLGMDTEASRRFERGADCENVLRAQTRCIELICEIAGGVATENAIDIYPSPVTRRSVDFRPARVEGLTSLKVELSEMNRILGGLGFVRNADSGDRLNFTAPSWRVDIALEEDLIEELARHTGYEKIRSELPPSSMAGEYQPAEMKRRELRRALKSSGFDEAVNFSFIETGHDEEFETIPAFASDGRRQAFVSLRNPILEEAVRMRPTLLPGLLKAVRHNLNQGLRDVHLFEIGRIFAGSEANELPQEREALGLVATGGASEEGRAQAPRELDLYDLKGSLEAAIEVTNLGPIQFTKGTIKHLREGQAAIMKLANGTTIGTMGRLAASVAESYKFRQPVYVAELDLTALLQSEEKVVQYRPLPRYPSVVRDLTLLVARQVTFTDLLQAIDSLNLSHYRGTRLVGTYEGPNIPEGSRSITLRIEYRADDRTLRDAEVEEQQRGLTDALLKNFNAELH